MKRKVNYLFLVYVGDSAMSKKLFGVQTAVCSARTNYTETAGVHNVVIVNKENDQRTNSGITN